jgi:CelD/BcsL family acetyltransferase involved in cellulose biosynthesis
MAVMLDTTYGSADAVAAKKADSWSLSVAASLDGLAAEWRTLENRAPVSPYQRFDLTAAWCRHAAPASGVEPRIGVVRDEHARLVMVLPLGLTRRMGLTVASYLGGTHFNINMPLVDPGFHLTGERLLEVLDRYCELTGADLLSLCFQPRTWSERPHPFLELRHHAATDNMRMVRIRGPFDSYYKEQLSKNARSKLRRKRQRFETPGSVVFASPQTPADVDRFVAAMVEQRSSRLLSQGIRDSFADPGIASFLREAAVGGLGGQGGLELHAIDFEGDLVSVRAGVTHRDHHSLMITSFDPQHALAKYSPSEVLAHDILEDLRSRGVTSFDFGVGDGQHKKVWSNDAADLFDVAYAATARGFVIARLFRVRTNLVRFIKRNEVLFARVKALRSFMARGVARPNEAASP